MKIIIAALLVGYILGWYVSGLTLRPSKYVQVFAWRTPKGAASTLPWNLPWALPWGYWFRPNQRRCLRVHTPLISVEVNWTRQDDSQYLGLPSDPRLFRWVPMAGIKRANRLYKWLSR